MGRGHQRLEAVLGGQVPAAHVAVLAPRYERLLPVRKHLHPQQQPQSLSASRTVTIVLPSAVVVGQTASVVYTATA